MSCHFVVNLNVNELENLNVGALQCSVMQCNAMQCNTSHCNATHTTIHGMVEWSTVQRCVIRYSTVLYFYGCTALYCVVVLCFVVTYCVAMQSNKVAYCAAT